MISYLRSLWASLRELVLSEEVVIGEAACREILGAGLDRLRPLGSGYGVHAKAHKEPLGDFEVQLDRPYPGAAWAAVVLFGTAGQYTIGTDMDAATALVKGLDKAVAMQRKGEV